MTAETSLVTFCPKCGERCDDAALRACRKCAHDLRTEVTIAPMWTAGQPALPPPAWPTSAPGFDPSGWPAPVAAAAWPTPGPAPDPAATASPEPATPVTPADVPPPRPEARIVSPSGWHADPYGRHEYRWWDGSVWSHHVSDRGQVAVDPAL